MDDLHKYREQVRLDLSQQAKLGVATATKALKLPEDRFNGIVDDCYAPLWGSHDITDAADLVATLCVIGE